jgi:diacylglycerol kinase
MMFLSDVRNFYEKNIMYYIYIIITFFLNSQIIQYLFLHFYSLLNLTDLNNM